MFNDEKKQSMPNVPNINQQKAPAEDMFAPVDNNKEQPLVPRDSTSQAGLNTNSPFNQAPVIPVEATKKRESHVANEDFVGDSKSGKSKNELKYLIIGILSLLVVLIAGFFVYQNILKPKFLSDVPAEVVAQDSYSDEASLAPVDELDLNTIEDDTLNNSEEGAIDDVMMVGEGIDTDDDGLTDEKEMQIGTDRNMADTDGDGLTDGEEVNKWETNPLDADTDADGYDDGSEVAGRYNPNGSGKLYEAVE